MFLHNHYGNQNILELFNQYFLYEYEEIETKELAIAITFSIIDAFVILIFVELIELNFLGLSTMTKRNIELRARHDSMEGDINDIIIEKKIDLGEYELELKNE